MDLNTVIGAALAFVLVLGAMAIGPGGIAVFIHIPSMIIVFGGTLAVTMLAFPVPDLKPVIKVMLVTALRKTSTPTEEIDRIVARTQPHTAGFGWHARIGEYRRLLLAGLDRPA